MVKKFGCTNIHVLAADTVCLCYTYLHSYIYNDLLECDAIVIDHTNPQCVEMEHIYTSHLTTMKFTVLGDISHLDRLNIILTIVRAMQQSSAVQFVCFQSHTYKMFLYFFTDIFTNYRAQATEQMGFADCSYFEGSSSTGFAPVAPPVVTGTQLLSDTQLAQVQLKKMVSLASYCYISAEYRMFLSSKPPFTQENDPHSTLLDQHNLLESG